MKTIPLTKGKLALVDDEDWNELSQFKWTAMFNKGQWCAYRKIGDKNIYMHREIMRATNQEVDHIDHDGLNNQKSNLRLCNRTQNNGNTRLNRRNTSGFKGVHFNRGKWQAGICRGDKCFCVGRTNNPKDAAILYDKAARSYFGEFALTNERLGLL